MRLTLPHKTLRDDAARLNFQHLVQWASSSFGDAPMLSPPVVSSLPVASARYRGSIVFVRGGPGEYDTLNLCVKNDGDLYEWVVLSSAAPF